MDMSSEHPLASRESEDVSEPVERGNNDATERIAENTQDLNPVRMEVDADSLHIANKGTNNVGEVEDGELSIDVSMTVSEDDQ